MFTSLQEDGFDITWIGIGDKQTIVNVGGSNQHILRDSVLNGSGADVRIKRTDGGLFSFNSLDLNNDTNGGEYRIDVYEENDTNTTTQLRPTSSSFSTYNNPSPSPISVLNINIVSFSAVFGVDNINLTPAYGLFALAADGTWTYTLDTDMADTLAEGATATETFTATVTDDKGATATETVTITITGTNDAPTTLLVAGGQDSSVESQQGVHELTQDELQPIVDEAIARWNDVLDSETAATLLDSVRFEIADLPDALLGSASSTVVSLDTDAAGHGWFVDATPDDDAEFGRLVADTEYAASENSEAFGAIDLLTVVMHELGHMLGQAHTDAPDVMAEELATSTRRVPSQQEDETGKSAAIAVDSALRINRPSSPADLNALNITDDLVDLLAKDIVRPAAI